MNTRRIRNLAFLSHRYIGLAVALILMIVGLTGSLLVFQSEFDSFAIAQQYGKVIPQGEKTPISSILSTVQAKYPNGKITGIITIPDDPYKVRVKLGNETKVAIANPYTGEIMGEYIQEKSLIPLLFKLHYQLMAGDLGETIVGITAFFLIVLSITGLLLWNGWKNIWLGFKIKWNAHPIRVNFDIHKVISMVSVIFLTAIAFTGLCWNFSDQTKPVIYAATFTPLPAPLTSKITENKSDFSIDLMLQKADEIFPTANTTFISLPQKPDAVVRIGKRQEGEIDHKFGDTRIYCDRYSGEVLRIEDALKATTAENILNWFTPLHYGTFGGLPTRILYVFIGISPLVLFITGAKMFKMRTLDKAKKKEVKDLERVL
jgi:uncharacterized iron-regulated membrane protein